MTPDLVKDLTTPYFSEGLLGVTCVVLALVVVKLWNQMNSERSAHKIELAAKDAKIDELYDERLAEAKAVADIARTVQASLDAFLSAIRGGKGL